MKYFSFFSVCKVSNSERRSSRLKNSLSPRAMKRTQEYEIMSKEFGAPRSSDIGVLSQADVLSIALCRNTAPSPSPTFTAPLPTKETLTSISAVRGKQEDKDSKGNPAEPRDSTEKCQLTGDCDSEFQAVNEQEEAAQGIGRYEYMDIRRSDSTEGEDPAQERPGSLTSANKTGVTEEPDQSAEVLQKEQQEEEEVEKHHDTNKQPPVQEILSSVVMPRPDVLKAGGEKVEEYEEMTRLVGVPNRWEHADYQNLSVTGRVAPVDTENGRCAGIGGYIKVCAGTGEPGSNTSFDNPDYWHSRLFLKPDAVRTS